MRVVDLVEGDEEECQGQALAVDLEQECQPSTRFEVVEYGLAGRIFRRL